MIIAWATFCALEESGQADDTLVLYVSDHGEMLGDHGLWTNKVIYEASPGVTMISAGPDVPVGKWVRIPTSLIDIAPTALDVFGLASGYPGTILSQLARVLDDPDERRDLAYANAPEVQAALSEGERRLREICDPDAVNALCFAEWCRRIEALGGETACLNAAQFNHTPTPV